MTKRSFDKDYETTVPKRFCMERKTMLTPFMRHPCRARNMPVDHDEDSAYFDILPDARHGLLLECHHVMCAKLPKRFRYCAVCKVPVSKRNFSKRHDHGLLGTSPALLLSDSESDKLDDISTNNNNNSNDNEQQGKERVNLLKKCPSSFCDETQVKVWVDSLISVAYKQQQQHQQQSPVVTTESETSNAHVRCHEIVVKSPAVAAVETVSVVTAEYNDHELSSLEDNVDIDETSDALLCDHFMSISCFCLNEIDPETEALMTAFEDR